MAKAQLYIVIDIETTGLDPYRDKIIEVGAVKLQRGLVIDEFSTLVNPERRISEDITELTSIDNDMVADAPVFEDVLSELKNFIKDGILIAHNASFEEKFLSPYLQERFWVDSIAFAQIVFPTQSSYSLENLAKSLLLGKYEAHRALADSQMTAKLFNFCLNTLDNFDDTLKAALHKISSSSDNALADLIKSRTRDAAKEDEKFTIRSLNTYQKARINEKADDEHYQINLQEIEDYFKEDGYYEQRLEGFESRPQQLKMSKEVAKAFNESHFLLAEAGTGTGKSLAYLLPAAIYSKKTGKRVAISTHTINLQEQLLNKDIPILCKLLNENIEAAVLKGRSNYLCLSLYQSYINQGEGRHWVFLSRLAVWLHKTQKGDGSELNLQSRERWQWNMLCGSRENCLSPYCRFVNGACFVSKSRQVAENADIFILNHSLLLANATLERSVLPPLPYLIIDEAHHLEKTAESQFAQSVDFYDMMFQLGRLQRIEKKKKTGLVPRIIKEAKEFFKDESELTKIDNKIGLIEDALDKTAKAGGELFQKLQSSYWVEVGKSGFFPATLRIDNNAREEERWFDAENSGESLAFELKDLARLLYRLWENLSIAESEDDTNLKMESKDQLKGLVSGLQGLSENLTAMFNGNEGFVVWLEFPSEDKFPSLQMAPLALGETLHSTIFQEKESVVLTSATLTAEKGSFRFFKEQTGLDLLEESPQELVLPSPFNYKSQSILAYCSDIPDPSKTSDIYFNDAISKAIFKLVKASQGRAVVLFTSHAQLKIVYNELRRPLAQEGITLLAHGISGSPNHLLERLRSEENCCILGANSFWEGIDVAGSALSLVIVVRLPFWPPNTPIMQERIEKMEAKGLNSFKNYSMPQAIIRFKQGFGRLIRTKDDKGVFCVLDCRIYSKFYGKSFEKALPEMEKVFGETSDVAVSIKNWLD